MSDRDDERMLSLFRGELDAEALDALLDDAERDPAVARRLADWQTLAGLAVDEHVEATRESAFAAFHARLGQAEAAQSSQAAQTARPDKAASDGVDGSATKRRGLSETPEARRGPRNGGGLGRLLARCRRWLVGEGGGLRPALTTFAAAVVLAQAGVIGWMLHDRDLAQGGASVVYRGGGNPCEQAVVSLAPGATVDGLMQWLGLHNATMLGPDENGRFTLIASDPAALRALLADPQASALVASRQTAPATCAAGH
ncbi:hypothetical protein LA345_12800 [Burkholderia vietnamiensis]|uniref:Uncharacterized protein n=1 Tax=Burkholderia vietnamiensis (strain G4 / LMG 22486) TaxID=269482 RepID=A4JFH8_BURVG|nr:hypothetical protein Bcep1808_2029 [Burkholderia vietnamiensis G4]MCB4344790.1 hypothetical protein [Burkholderia vietnamiensis]